MTSDSDWLVCPVCDQGVDWGTPLRESQASSLDIFPCRCGRLSCRMNRDRQSATAGWRLDVRVGGQRKILMTGFDHGIMYEEIDGRWAATVEQHDHFPELVESVLAALMLEAVLES